MMTEQQLAEIKNVVLFAFSREEMDNQSGKIRPTNNDNHSILGY
jgi:hypothetical protein